MKFLGSVVFLVAAFFARPGCGHGEEQLRLHQDLFNANTKFNVPPKRNASEPVQVKVGFALHRIVDLNEKTQTLHSSVWLRVKWVDERLQWDPQKYNNIKHFVTTHPIWIPDVILYNDVRDADRPLMMLSKRLYHDGCVVWLAPVVYLSLCLLEPFYFPFDEQRCEFTFGSSSYNDQELEIVNMSATGDMSPYTSNGEWDIVAIPVKMSHTRDNFRDLTYTVVLQRRGTYYLIALILPLFFMVLLTTSSFYLPVESGEKGLLSVVVFLSHMVYTVVVVALLPPPSGSLPLIEHYLLQVQILTAMSTILNVAVVQIHYRGEHRWKMPTWAKRLVHHSIGQRLKITPQVKRKNKEEKIELTRKMLLFGMNAVRNAFVVEGTAPDGPSPATPVTDKGPFGDRRDVTDTPGYRRLQRNILTCLTHMNMETSETAALRATRYDWAQLAMVCDRVCLYSYVFISVVVIIIIATRVLNAPHVDWGK